MLSSRLLAQSLINSCRYACPICWMRTLKKFNRFLPESEQLQQRRVGGENRCLWSFPLPDLCWKQSRRCYAKFQWLSLRFWKSWEECIRLRDNEDLHADSLTVSSWSCKQQLGFSISSFFWCPRSLFFGPASQLEEFEGAKTAILICRSPSWLSLVFPRFLANPPHNSTSSNSTAVNSSFPTSWLATFLLALFSRSSLLKWQA